MISYPRNMTNILLPPACLLLFIAISAAQAQVNIAKYPDRVPGSCPGEVGTQFDCGDSNCIPINQVRNCANDCADGSDELCGVGEILCDTLTDKCATVGCGKCADEQARASVCQDRLYEKFCETFANDSSTILLTCRFTPNCVLGDWAMDGLDDCGDWSDEDPCYVNEKLPALFASPCTIAGQTCTFDKCTDESQCSAAQSTTAVQTTAPVTTTTQAPTTTTTTTPTTTTSTTTTTTPTTTTPTTTTSTTTTTPSTTTTSTTTPPATTTTPQPTTTTRVATTVQTTTTTSTTTAAATTGNPVTTNTPPPTTPAPTPPPYFGDPCWICDNGCGQHKSSRCTDGEFITYRNEILCYVDCIKPRDCADLHFKMKPHFYSGYFQIYNPRAGVKYVYCDADFDGGGWTTIQRRWYGNENFFRGWDDYEKGFGVATLDHWLGNNFISAMTTDIIRPYSLAILIKRYIGAKFPVRSSTYQYFGVLPAQANYTMFVTNFTGGDAGDVFSESNLQPFGTKDKQHIDSKVTCGSYYQSGWWFLRDCARSSILNVPYWPSPTIPHLQGIEYNMNGTYVRLQQTLMMIRPTLYDPNSDSIPPYLGNFSLNAGLISTPAKHSNYAWILLAVLAESMILNM